MDYCFLLAEDPGDHNGWTPLAYTCQELVDGVLNNIRDGGPSAKHLFCGRELHKLYWVGAEEEKLLTEYWDFFNEFFFSNALTSERSSWGIVEQNNPAWNGSLYFGRTKSNRGNLDPHHDPDVSRYSVNALISIYESSEKDPKERLRLYIQTMLHEMIHVFIYNYACFCSRCKTKYEDDEGKTGHGKAWQSIAYEIEIFVRNELDVDLNLNRVVSIAEELYECRVDVSCGYLSAFNVDEHQLADELTARYRNYNETRNRQSSGTAPSENAVASESYFSSDDSSSSEYDDCSNTNPVEESSQKLDGE
jgi:hypothetical protein